jgi:hypothetical protein
MPRKPGSHTKNPRQRTARDRAWQSMRSLTLFTVPDLVATADIAYSNAGKYVQGLAAAGYLRVAHPKAEGKKGGHAHYRLIRNTGPQAPRLRSDGYVYDLNTRAVWEPKEGGQ